VTSVAKEPKFRPQNTKGAEINCVGPGKSGAELLADLSKRAQKGPNFFVVWFCTKTVIFLADNFNLSLIHSKCLYYLLLGLCEKYNNISLSDYIL
jgi:lysine/ornithine N-monooxygenase